MSAETTSKREKRLTAHLQFRLSAEQAERLRRGAEMSRRSRSDFVRLAVEDALDALGLA